MKIIDNIISYSLNMTPNFIKELPIGISAFFMSVIPYSPMNMLIFFTIFLVIGITNIFNLSKENTYSCKYNKLQTETSRSYITIFKNSYKIYLFISFVLNFNVLIM